MTRRMLVVAAALVVLAMSASAPAQDESSTPPYAPYVFTRADALLAAQACVHEVSWAGGTATTDCGMIIQVVMERREGDESFSSALRLRTMPNFYAGETDRAWTRGLPEGPIRRNPRFTRASTGEEVAWPYEYPASVHSDHWRLVYERVHGYMRGREALPCTPAPVRWFGRTTDGEQLARALEEGWCEPSCAGELRNAPLVRCPAGAE